MNPKKALVSEKVMGIKVTKMPHASSITTLDGSLPHSSLRCFTAQTPIKYMNPDNRIKIIDNQLELWFV